MTTVVLHAWMGVPAIWTLLYIVAMALFWKDDELDAFGGLTTIAFGVGLVLIFTSRFLP